MNKKALEERIADISDLAHAFWATSGHTPSGDAFIDAFSSKVNESSKPLALFSDGGFVATVAPESRELEDNELGYFAAFATLTQMLNITLNDSLDVYDGTVPDEDARAMAATLLGHASAIRKLAGASAPTNRSHTALMTAMDRLTCKIHEIAGEGARALPLSAAVVSVVATA